MGERFLAGAFRRVGLTAHLLRRLARRGGMVALTYHRIGASQPTDPLGRALCSVGMSFTEEEFARQIELVVSQFTVISIDDFLETRENGGGLPDRAVLLTFDDGLRETTEIVLPVLARYGLSATFSLVGAHLARERLAPLLRLYSWLGDRDRGQVEWLPEDRRMRVAVISGGSEARNVAGRAELPRDREGSILDQTFLSAEQASELVDRGHTVAAHGCEHLMCARLSPHELTDDIRHCSTAIEKAVGEAPRVFVYPYGISASFSEQTKAALAALPAGTR